MSSKVKFFPATNDIIFKALFVQNPFLLKNFIASALSINEADITNIKILNSEVPPNFYDGKLTRLDILLETTTDIINIEMQVAEKDDYKERSLFYWARMYSEQVGKGEDYDSAKRCVCINIINFNMFECNEFHSEFMALEKERYELLTDRLDIHFFELPKVAKINNENKSEEDMLKLWMRLFKAKSEEEMDMLINTNDVIKTGVNVIYDLSADEKIRETIRQREKALLDYRADIKHAMDEGEAKGITKRDNQLIAKWRAKGMTDEQIKELLD